MNIHKFSVVHLCNLWSSLYYYYAFSLIWIPKIYVFFRCQSYPSLRADNKCNHFIAILMICLSTILQLILWEFSSILYDLSFECFVVNGNFIQNIWMNRKLKAHSNSVKIGNHPCFNRTFTKNRYFMWLFHSRQRLCPLHLLSIFHLVHLNGIISYCTTVMTEVVKK